MAAESLTKKRKGGHKNLSKSINHLPSYVLTSHICCFTFDLAINYLPMVKSEKYILVIASYEKRTEFCAHILN
ncbi:MAG: hypothetical protein CRN43_04945 [Candidatus Nephrothrix sp. EaCA]|nr:MAG: hypothetical protein CRN43_04945 [Candidatus Nephrothrix sp. EaCA]